MHIKKIDSILKGHTKGNLHANRENLLLNKKYSNNRLKFYLYKAYFL